jgi:hypothetical protein
MAPMGASDSGDLTSVAGSIEPVVNCRADAAALDWWFARTVMTGNQKQDSVTPPDRAVKRTVDRQPSAVEVEPVKVENLIGLDRT